MDGNVIIVIAALGLLTILYEILIYFPKKSLKMEYKKTTSKLTLFLKS